VNCQKAIFVASYAVLKAFSSRMPECIPVATAGLSLGEYTALAASKRATFQDLLPIVHMRATLMQEACEAVKSSMNVVLGQEPTWVNEVLKECGLPVWIANLNCPGQVVIAGDVHSLSEAAEILKAKGAKRVLPLDVSGAFHTPLMATAREGLAPYLHELTLSNSHIPLIMNAIGESISDSDQIRKLLIEFYNLIYKSQFIKIKIYHHLQRAPHLKLPDCYLNYIHLPLQKYSILYIHIHLSP
jgi:[acyl-carrier-protein] S-malonyltransferase